MRKAGKAAKAPSDETIRALLEKHGCPVSFHEVRTRFLGSIATPAPTVSPIRVIEDLWGGSLPAFDSMDDANELIGALAEGLWNDLVRHQKRGSPFRLTRMPMEPTAANLERFGRVRLEELNGFIEGLFDGEEAIDLPERAHHAVGHLFELRRMMAGLSDLASRDSGGEDSARLEPIFSQLRELNRIMETEMHEAVLSCARARRRMAEDVAAEPPTIH